MGGPRRGIRRLFHLGLWGPAVDDGVDWEIQHHLEERADELEAEGWSREEALRAARREFGDVAAVRRELRAADRGEDRRRRFVTWLATVLQDLRYGLRGTRRNPTFSFTLVLTLGLGIGASVAVFGLVDALLLRPLPYADSEELAQVMVSPEGQRWTAGSLPLDVVREWRLDGAGGRSASTGGGAIRGLLPHRSQRMLYTGGREPRELQGQMVGSSFEEVLGVQPILGRGFAEADAVPGSAPVVILNYSFWRRELSADPEVVGRTVRLNDVPYTVIGVMPRGFKFPEYAAREVWVPLPLAGGAGGGRGELLVRASGDIEAAEAMAQAQARGLFEGRGMLDGATLSLMPLESKRGGGQGEIRRAIWLLFGAVGLILLVSTVNGVNLLLVRGAGRRREVAVRHSLGASNGRLVRQLMTETLAFALGSGVVALSVAWLALQGMRGVLPQSLAFWLPHALGIEERALLFAFGTAVAAGLALGVMSALKVVRSARSHTRAGLTPHASGSRERSRLRRGLVVGEVALSVVLLVGAGLLLNSFLRLTAVDIGIDTENLALLTTPISAQAQPDSAARTAFLPSLEKRIRGLPGVVAATATAGLPATTIAFGTTLQAEGRSPAGGDPDVLPMVGASPEFFNVLGARLLAGRPFRSGEERDDVAIVDADLAGHLWPHGAAVGRRFRFDENSPWLRVVGVMADMQLERRDDRHGDFEVLRPFDATRASGYVTVAFRTAGDPTRLFGQVREAVYEIAPNQPIHELLPADDVYGETLQLPRFLALLVSGLAAFALALAAVGLFGVLAYDVSQRRREIGVRMSMGATAPALRRMVVGEGMVLAVVGAAIGVVVAIGLSRFLEGLLFDLEPTDPATLSVVVAAMLATAALASYLPARRATRVDPAEIMRAE